MPFDKDQDLNRQDFVALNKMLDGMLVKDHQQLAVADHTQLLNSVSKSIAILQKVHAYKSGLDVSDVVECFPRPILAHSLRADLASAEAICIARRYSSEGNLEAYCSGKFFQRKDTNEDFGVQTESDEECQDEKTKKKSSCTIM